MSYSTDSTHSTRSRVRGQFFTTLLLLLCLAAVPALAGEPEENDPDPGLAQPGQSQPAVPPSAEQQAPGATARAAASRQDDDLGQRLLGAWEWVLDLAGLGVTG